MDYIGHDSGDPMNYAAVLRRWGSRKNLDRAAAMGDLAARLWREAPALMARAEREEAQAAAAARLLTRPASAARNESTAPDVGTA